MLVMSRYVLFLLSIRSVRRVQRLYLFSMAFWVCPGLLNVIWFLK